MIERRRLIDDQMLVARVMASHDSGAYGELIRRHQSQVRNFLRRLTRDPSLADDLAQDAFMHAWDKIHTFTGKGSFIGWLLKVAYTTFLQSRRKTDRYDEILQSVGEHGGSVSYPEESDEVSDLEKFLAVLNEQERAVMILSYSCGLSHREISDTTGQPAGTVKSLISRSKDKIRKHFEIEHHQYG